MLQWDRELQPCDMGVIRNLKGFYRSKLYVKIILELDENPEAQMKDVIKKVSLLDTVHLLSNSWDCVKKETIQNCWKKGGFKIKDDVVGDYNAADENDLADVPLPPNMDAAAFEAIVNVF